MNGNLNQEIAIRFGMYLWIVIPRLLHADFVVDVGSDAGIGLASEVPVEHVVIDIIVGAGCDIVIGGTGENIVKLECGDVDVAY